MVLYLCWYLREFAISLKFGAGTEMDVFAVAYTIPTFFAAAAASLAQAVLTPLYIRLRDRSPAGLAAFCSDLYSVLVFGSLLTIGLLALSSHWLTTLIAAGFTGPRQDLLNQLLWIMLPIVPCGVLFGMASAFLLGENRVALATALPALSSIVPAGFVFLIGDQIGIHSYALGLTAGWGLQAIVAIAVLRHCGVTLQLNWHWRSWELGQTARLSGLGLIGVVAVGTIPIIDRAMASELPTGSIASLAYAERLVNLVLALLSAIQTPILPLFSRQAGQGELGALRHHLGYALTLGLFLALPVTLSLLLFAEPVVRLLFGRGEFDEVAVRMTAAALAAYSVGLVGAVVQSILARVLHAVQALVALGIFGVAMPILKFGFNLWLIPIWGASGVAWSFSAMTLLVVGMLVIQVYRHLGSFSSVVFWQSLVKIGLALGGMALVVWVGTAGGATLAVGQWWWLVWMIVGLVTYAVVCGVLRLEVFWLALQQCVVRPLRALYLR